MEEKKLKVLNLETALKDAPNEYKAMKALVEAALFDPEEMVSIESIRTLNKKYKNLIKKCYIEEGMIFLEMSPDSDISKIFYVGQVPEEYLGKKVDKDLSRILDLT